MTDQPNEPQVNEPEPESSELEIPAAEVEDPIGDISDGEAGSSLAPESESDGESEIADSEAEDESEAGEADPESNPKPRPPAKLERLQKILAQAGVASRRKAEEMIEQGRIQINGKIVTEPGTKADAGRDHIRVDGKLLQGAERLRYFVLNKPRGFVTTVKDPEGRPTVMQFFEKMRERLYPVGRLDYMSEGLLLVTNDGELANRLTRAASGVEKTYLVKVAGQPTESELETLRGGVSIARGKPGSPQVRTSPARIRQVRQGDNPWYEVVLIEGRNRELRKMFEEVGHFVEKIRRVGYGPLVLDQEPGNLRELDAEELALLRKAADGTLRTPKSKEIRRRNAMDAAGLPTVKPRPTIHPRPARPTAERSADRSAAGDYRPKKSFGQNTEKPLRPSRPAGEEFRPAAGRSQSRSFDRPATRSDGRPDDRTRATSPGSSRFRATGPADRTDRSGARPTFKKDDRGARSSSHPAARFGSGPTGESRSGSDRASTGRPFSGPSGTGRTGSGRPFGAKPAWKKAGSDDRPANKRPSPPARASRVPDEDFGPVRAPNLHIEEIQHSDRPSASRPSAPRPYSGRTNSAGPRTDRPRSDRPRPDGAGSDFPRPSSSRPFRGQGGLARPFTTSSGKPRAGGARPSSKPGRPAGRAPAGRPFGASGAAPTKRPYEGRPASPAKRPFRRDQAEGSFAPRGEKSAGWKPKPSFGGPSRPGAGTRPKPGGAAKSGYKGKPSGSGPKRTGPRPSGKRPGGRPSGDGGKRRG